MKIKTTHLYLGLFSLDVLVDMVLGGTLREAPGSAEEIAKRLRWKKALVLSLRGKEPVPALDGPDVLSMSVADLDGKSPLRARHMIENEFVKYLVLTLGGEDCNRLIGRMLGVKEWRIRRIRTRAGLPPARLMRGERIRTQKSTQAA